MKNPATSTDKAKKKFIRDIYVNREYSWLLFNKRVLDQAKDLTNPVLERCKFLAIFQSNLDEFFMVRVGSLYNENISDPQATDNKTELTAAKQLDGISSVVDGFYADRAACYNMLRKDINKCGIRILRADELTPRQSEECKEIFISHIMPLLSLMVLDAKHPLMQFENMKNYMVYDLERDGRRMIGVMAFNSALDRLYKVGSGKKSAADTFGGIGARFRASRLHRLYGKRRDDDARDAQCRLRYAYRRYRYGA